MAELQPLQFTVDPSAPLLDMVKDAVVGSLHALDEVEGVDFGGLGGVPGAAQLRAEAKVMRGGETIDVQVIATRTTPPSEPT